MSGEVVGYQRRGRRVGSHDWNAWLPCSADAFNQIGANRTIGGFELESRALVLATEYAALQAKLDAVTKDARWLLDLIDENEGRTAYSLRAQHTMTDIERRFTDQGRAGEGA